MNIPSALLRVRTIMQWIAVAAVLGYCANKQYENYRRDTALKMAVAELKAKIIAELRGVVTLHSADALWSKELVGSSSIRMSPVMSAEVQQVWQRGKPILFVGVLQDVEKISDKSYAVVTRQSGLLGEYSFFSTEFQITVECSPDVTAPILKMARSSSRLPIFPDVAVVTVISNISSHQMPGKDGEQVTEFKAKGSCLALIALPDDLPRGWQTESSAK